ncbi:hypothetical protein SAMN04489834_3114 [Microterricola viridarii]|uniref:DUF3558 domain-containing protein n=2 Tax=Microterricola viridarii TaxID=412690 RepID=A0A1H1YK70_9MICO|nr:hypothetical protein SAMN04489834_3114 [Microterricola viridarii]
MSAAALGIALFLSACAGQPAPGSTAPPSERPQPSESPSAAPIEAAPSARLAAGCDELVPPALLVPVFAEELSLRPIGFDHSSNGPVAVSLLQLGSVNCVWANDQTLQPWESASVKGYRGVHLTVVPEGEAPWLAYAETYSGGQEVPFAHSENALGPRCVAEIESCFFQALVGAAWVDLTITGVGAADTSNDDELVELITPLTDALVQTLSAEPEAPPRWTVPTTVLPLPADCTDFLSDAQAEEFAAAGPLSVGVFWDGPRVGQFNHGMNETGAQRCHLNMADSDSGIGYFDYLPGGGWGFDALHEGWKAAGTITADTVPGLRAGDAAVIRCGVPEEACTADIRFGGNWIQLNLTAYLPDQFMYPEGVDIRVGRDNIADFAAAIVANLNGAVS